MVVSTTKPLSSGTISWACPTRDRMDEASSSPSIQNINNLPAGDTNSCLCLLLSLQWTAATDDDHDDPTGFSKAVQDVWRWKDAVLGDGRDFFVPKPKTLRALQSAIQQQNDCITECVVLSNCARFEILLVVTAASNQPQANENDNNDNNNNIHDLLNSISSFILFQVRCYQRQQQQQQWNRNLSPFLLLPMDNPQLIFPFQMTFSNTKIDHSSSSVSTDDDNDDKNVKDLSRHWSIRTNVQEIVEHMCEVAAGMAERPRRPGRTVPFRPFSSRDAHILLQLKRTFDVTNNNQQQQQQQHDQTKNQKKPNTETTTTTSIILPKLLQTAIRAGRAARNPKIVPELVQLRQTYGTGDSKYDIEPPMEVSQRVAEAAKRQAIDPIIQEFMEDRMAREFSMAIAAFRDRAKALALDENELQIVQTMLHSPTIALRQGKAVNESEFMETLSNKLISHRRRARLKQPR